MDTRIYTVTEKETGKKLLVEANHPSTAIRLVTERAFTVAVTPSVELASLLEGGLRVIRATPQPQRQEEAGEVTPA